MALAQALISGNSQAIGPYLVPPPHLAETNPVERQRLVLDLLDSEISPEGMAILARDGSFGPLRELFPTEADAWAKAFSVNVDDCVAFRLQRGNTTAELVLHRQPDTTYRVLRCNDIRQLANPPSQP